MTREYIAMVLKNKDCPLGTSKIEGNFRKQIASDSTRRNQSL
jgi:hypothetical protein